jgi:ribosome biogenesis GTPase A
MAVQWFPGHMAKTRRLIGENIRLVDAVVELVDARIPQSSRNPVLDELLGGKPRLLVLNKADLADPEVSELWAAWYRSQGILSLVCDSHSPRGGVEQVPAAVRGMLREKLSRQAEKGMTRAVKMMVAGIPNVGKSAFINRLAGKKSAKTEDRPGVTRGKQWIRLETGLELLDTPGILWPKLEETAGYRLAFTGAVRDRPTDIEDVASRLLLELLALYPDRLIGRYKLQAPEGLSGFSLLEAVGRARGFLAAGGEVDTLRAAAVVLDEFRGARIGRISLERP